MDTEHQQPSVRYDNVKSLRTQGDDYWDQRRQQQQQHNERCERGQGHGLCELNNTSAYEGKTQARAPPPPPPPKPRRNRNRRPSPSPNAFPNGTSQPRRGSEPVARSAASCPSSPLTGRRSWCPSPCPTSRLHHRQDAALSTAPATGEHHHHHHHDQTHGSDRARAFTPDHAGSDNSHVASRSRAASAAKVESCARRPSAPTPHQRQEAQRQHHRPRHQPDQGSRDEHRGRRPSAMLAIHGNSSRESVLSTASHRSSHSAGEPHCRLLRSVDLSALLQDSAGHQPTLTPSPRPATIGVVDQEESCRRASQDAGSEADSSEVDFFGPRRAVSPRTSRGSLSSVSSALSASATSPTPNSKGAKKKLRKKKERERQRQRRITPPALVRPLAAAHRQPQEECGCDASAYNSDCNADAATPVASPNTQRRCNQPTPSCDSTNENTPPASPHTPCAPGSESAWAPHVRVAVADEERGASSGGGGKQRGRGCDCGHHRGHGTTEGDRRESIVRGVLSKVNSLASVMSPRRRRKVLGKVRTVVETSDVTLAGVEERLPAAVSEELVRRMSQMRKPQQQEGQLVVGSDGTLAPPGPTRKADKGSNYSLDVPDPGHVSKCSGSRTSLAMLPPGAVRDARCSDTGTDTSSATSSCCSSHRNSRAWCARGSARSTTSASSLDSRWSARESDDPGYAAIDSDALAQDSDGDSIVHEGDAAARYNLLRTSTGDSERYSRALSRAHHDDDDKMMARSDEDSAYARISQVLCDELWDNGWLSDTRFDDSDLDNYDEDYDPTAVYTKVVPKELRNKSPPLPIREYILKHYKFKGEGPEPRTNDESRAQARRAAYLYHLKIGQKRRNSPKRCLRRTSRPATPQA